MKKATLYDKLIEYGKNGNYPFHMPGHKRTVNLMNGIDPFQVDITEIDGFDNLHHAEGIIKDAMDNAAAFFGTDRTWFLVNGSTCGILAAINAVTDIGDSIVIGRNCHKSVYHAAELRDLKVDYLYPDYVEEYGINGGYNPQQLENILNKNINVKAVILTSPTYDGIVSDIEKLASITHKYGAILIVDEAHGAHLGITDKLPKAAYELGADIVIESVHKTLPSLTQTALLHLKSNNVEASKIEECLGIYETSSPSYLFMASIDRCIRQLQSNGRHELEELLITVKKFRENVNNLQYIHVPGRELKEISNIYDVDETKLVIHVEPQVLSGSELMDVLRNQYHFEMEMQAPQYVLGITTVCDDKDEILRLAESLKEIDAQLIERAKSANIQTNIRKYDKINFELLQNEIQTSIYEAKRSSKQLIDLEKAAGYVSGEYLYLYPPGIPLLVPGEMISKHLLEQIKEFKNRHMNLQGLRDKENRKIHVIKN